MTYQINKDVPYTWRIKWLNKFFLTKSTLLYFKNIDNPHNYLWHWTIHCFLDSLKQSLSTSLYALVKLFLSRWPLKSNSYQNNINRLLNIVKTYIEEYIMKNYVANISTAKLMLSHLITIVGQLSGSKLNALKTLDESL